MGDGSMKRASGWAAVDEGGSVAEHWVQCTLQAAPDTSERRDGTLADKRDG